MPNYRTMPTRTQNGQRHDAYLSEQERFGSEVCRECGAVYRNGRWYAAAGAPPAERDAAEPHEVVCPGCKKVQGHMPGGVLTLSGSFLEDERHREEVRRLIDNEVRAAQAVNPLERIVTTDEARGAITIETTNEKLAQRLGRAVHHACGGNLEYKWADGGVARVIWKR